MPVARLAIHPKPECRTALVRELRVVASAAGYGDRCGTRPRARRVYAGPERADRFLTISFQCKQAKRGRQKYTRILETHFDGNSLRYQARIDKTAFSWEWRVGTRRLTEIRAHRSIGVQIHLTHGSLPQSEMSYFPPS